MDLLRSKATTSATSLEKPAFRDNQLRNEGCRAVMLLGEAMKQTLTHISSWERPDEEPEHSLSLFLLGSPKSQMGLGEMSGVVDITSKVVTKVIVHTFDIEFVMV